jgi:hypothetical protein
MITTSQKTLVEREEEAVQQIHWLQCWRAYQGSDPSVSFHNQSPKTNPQEQSPVNWFLLSDLPLPAAGDIPGMTVSEAIQVFHVI